MSLTTTGPRVRRWGPRRAVVGAKWYHYLMRTHVIFTTDNPASVKLFWAKVAKSDNCWLWTGCRNRAGYGQLHRQIDGKSLGILAHRFSYVLAYGQIPDGLTLDHLCRTHACVRPDHLEAVSMRENVQRGARLRTPTECPAGHLYDEANTYWQDGGRYRACRKCHVRRVVAAKKAKRLARIGATA
jgi:hypothetical protein